MNPSLATKPLTAFYTLFLRDQLSSWDHTDPEKGMRFGRDIKYQ